MLKRTVLAIITLALVACAEDSDDSSMQGTSREGMSRGSATVELDGNEQTLREWDAQFSVIEEAGDRDSLELSITAENEDQGEEAITVFVTLSKSLEREALSLVGTYETESATIRTGGETLNEVTGATLTIESHRAGRIAGTIAFRMDEREASADFEGAVAGTCYERAGDGWEGTPITSEFCSQHFQ